MLEAWNKFILLDKNRNKGERAHKKQKKGGCSDNALQEAGDVSIRR